MTVSRRKGGQQLLNEFIEELALNLPKFMEASGKDKAKTLLQIIGVGEQLSDLEREEKELYQERLYVGRTADQKEKFANEQPYFPDAPDAPVSAAELIREQQEILARNGENQKKRDRACELERLAEQAERELSFAFGQAAEAEKRLEEAKAKYNKAMEDKEVAFRTASELQDESTEELEASIANAEEINRKVRANLDKGKAAFLSGKIRYCLPLLVSDLHRRQRRRRPLVRLRRLQGLREDLLREVRRRHRLTARPATSLCGCPPARCQAGGLFVRGGSQRRNS